MGMYSLAPSKMTEGHPSLKHSSSVYVSLIHATAALVPALFLSCLKYYDFSFECLVSGLFFSHSIGSEITSIIVRVLAVIHQLYNLNPF